MPKVTALGGRAFGRWFGYEDRTLMKGMSALLQKRPQKAPLRFAIWGYSKKPQTKQLSEPESGPSPDTKFARTRMLEFSAPRTIRNEYLLFVSHLVYSILWQRPKQTKTPVN